MPKSTPDRSDAEETRRSLRAPEPILPASPFDPALESAPTPRPESRRAKEPRTGMARTLRVLDLTRALVASSEPEELLDRAVDAALEALEAERAFVVLEGHGERRFEVARNFDKEEVKDPEGKISRTVLDRVLSEGEAVSIEDAIAPGASTLPSTASMGRLRLRSILCVPIRSGARIVGALYVDNRFRTAAFGDVERRLLEAIADHCGLALERARLLLEARGARERAEEAVSGLRDAVETQRFELARLRTALERDPGEAPLTGEYPAIVGRSRAMRRVLALLDKVTASDVPIRGTGESGTGKELVARALHFNSPRKLGPFVAENFAAIPESLAESELFGHMKGAFTGAIADRPGLFERAQKGTLFLDEIGDMSPILQKKLLRVLQEGTVRRLGGERSIPVDARIVAATHRDLRERVKAGEFREDLYYRLNVVEARLPPLRERTEDIPTLVMHFLEKTAKEDGGAQKGISREALRHLARRPWPGNVRELENAVRRLAALADETIGQRDVIALEAQSGASGAAGAGGISAGEGAKGGSGAWKTLAELEREQIERVLAACAWKPVEAARLLGISYTTLWRKMKSMGLRAGGGSAEAAAE